MSPAPRWNTLIRAVLAVGAAALVAAGCSSPPTPVPLPVGGQHDLFVDPDTPAAAQIEQWRAQGRTADAEQLRKIAEQPMPEWLTTPTWEVEEQARTYVEKAKAAGKRPFLVTYHIPGRDCDSYSGGGAADAADYREWTDEVAGAVRGTNALIIVEPDAVPQTIACGKGEERLDLIADSIAELKAAGATVYLDAGNPGFIHDTGQLVYALKRAGIEDADGFSLNVSNFLETEENIEFGKELSAALGGKHFVIDTGRNGNGGVDGDVDGGPGWCNPPGRALGTPPTFDTGEPLVDAFLWVKRVGESDGDCRPGEPRAGQWWPEYALELARNAKD
ncbi:glycoside hydrolase family 6 protein [Pseudonocardia thermophila]|uniref:glycoside hydrolase family 6 protein n=1 Tax=Pseudonocardia thermophila TaxID=1848 RepID=UPI00248DB870|nr:glycoside hydrolase family 6 protein [Pseudonocardia thermophila]